MAHPYDWPGDPGDRRRHHHDPGAYDRYGRPYDHRQDPRQDLERGWRRLSEGVHRAFGEDRSGAYGDPRRAGGMFGGEDRAGSLFSHRDGRGRPPPGPHRGKGPKGYVRSDARILEDVSDRLADDGRLDASDIEVVVAAGEVTLNGLVASRPDRRRAEDLAEQVSGVKRVQNNLRVRPSGTIAAETRTSASLAGAAVGATQPSPPPRTH